MTAIKAHAASISVLVLFIIGRFTGLVDMPPIEDFTTALMNVGGALLSMAVGWIVTYVSPANQPSAPQPFKGSSSFKSILLPLLMVGVLGTLVACASAEKIIAGAQITYNRATELAATYAERPRCTVPDAPALCSAQEVVDKMVAAAESADKALDLAWATFDSAQGDGDKIDVAVDAAMAAADILDELVLQFFAKTQTSQITIGSSDRTQIVFLRDRGHYIDLDGSSYFVISEDK